MPSVARRTINPAPAMLAFVNPKRKRGKSMAAHKRGRKRHSAPRVHHTRATHNPKRRHTTRRPRRHSVFARRTHNLVRHHRRHHRRRRNPTRLAGTGTEILNFTGAAIGLSILQPPLQRLVGPLLPFGQYNQPIVTAGTGYVLSWVFDLIPFTRRLSRPALILGFSTAVFQLVAPWIRGFIGGAAAPVNPTGMAAPMYRRGLRGIAAVPNTVPPGVAVPLPAPASAGSGMHGIASYPAVGSFMRKR